LQESTKTGKKKVAKGKMSGEEMGQKGGRVTQEEKTEEVKWKEGHQKCQDVNAGRTKNPAIIRRNKTDRQK